jgi:hypothetical protein
MREAKKNCEKEKHPKQHKPLKTNSLIQIKDLNYKKKSYYRIWRVSFQSHFLSKQSIGIRDFERKTSKSIPFRKDKKVLT